jgi:hypothetical protein
VLLSSSRLLVATILSHLLGIALPSEVIIFEFHSQFLSTVSALGTVAADKLSRDPRMAAQSPVASSTREAQSSSVPKLDLFAKIGAQFGQSNPSGYPMEILEDDLDLLDGPVVGSRSTNIRVEKPQLIIHSADGEEA